MLTHIDCFSGVGGICTGLHASGFETLLAIEKVDSCAETYSHNHPEVEVLCSDITKVTDQQIRDIIKGREVTLVTSGMPCETFSTAGATSRSFYDSRQYLFMEGIRVAKAVNAKFILFENVPGIATKRIAKNSRKLIIDDIYQALDEARYSNHLTAVLNASDFGVPQNRERFFILATNDMSIDLNQPVAEKKRKQVTVEEAFEDLPPVEANSRTEKTEYLDKSNEYISLLKNNAFWKLKDNAVALSYHRPPNHRSSTIERMKLTQPGEGLKDLFDKLDDKQIEEYQSRRVLPKKCYIQRGRRLINSAPSPTVTSHCLDELVHPVEDRALTVRECARLQGFPDAYEFVGGPYIVPHISHTQDKYEQIGDAVPPLLAYEWGKTIASLCEE